MSLPKGDLPREPPRRVNLPPPSSRACSTAQRAAWSVEHAPMRLSVAGDRRHPTTRHRRRWPIVSPPAGLSWGGRLLAPFFFSGAL